MVNPRIAENKRIKAIYKDLLGFCYPFAKKDELVKLRKAFDLVLKYNRESWEKTGEDYVFHSIEVARVALKELNLGITSVICALLHNVVDEKKVSLSQVKSEFDGEVALILEGYIKLSGIQTEKISIFSDNFRNLYLSLVKDIRVILIKLAHRMCDMRILSQLPKGKQKLFLAEVNHIYIPISHRLGLYNVKREMEELWMQHSHKAVYKSIARHIKESTSKQNAFIEDFIAPIEKALKKHNFKYTIKGRPKSIHSIWRKMKKQNVSFDEVYDLFAIRIILESKIKKEKSDCWRAYSIVTDIYQPNPSRLRDWISSPKPSGYESLHTTVLAQKGQWVEVQIRTNRMDEVAEQGLAAHWRYKEGSGKAEQEEWLGRIRDVIENPESDLLDSNPLTKIDISSDKVFVFTPEGDLRKLSKGATALDFAYEIHSSVGDMCNGARVNGKIVPIRYELQNGDKVEIITSKNQKPKLDWLGFVVSSKAKAKIKRALKEERLHEAELGKEILRRKLRNRKIQFSDTVVDKLIKQYKLSSSVDLYYLIAIEKIDLSGIKKTIIEDSDSSAEPSDSKNQKKVKTEPDRILADDAMIIDNDIDNLDYELAKCCNPISGDAVFGFVTVGKGISIHRISCPNARQMITRYNYRIIDVKWRRTEENKTYLTTIHVVGDDEMGILNNITDVISNDFKVNMVSVKIASDTESGFEGKFRLSVKDVKHLEMLTSRIMKVKGVKKATRMEIEE